MLPDDGRRTHRAPLSPETNITELRTRTPGHVLINQLPASCIPPFRSILTFLHSICVFNRTTQTTTVRRAWKTQQWDLGRRVSLAGFRSVSPLGDVADWGASCSKRVQETGRRGRRFTALGRYQRSADASPAKTTYPHFSLSAPTLLFPFISESLWSVMKGRLMNNSADTVFKKSTFFLDHTRSRDYTSSATQIFCSVQSGNPCEPC